MFSTLYRLLPILASLVYDTLSMAESPLYLTFEIKEETPIGEATSSFNAIVKDWMTKQGVAVLETAELSNALALAGDSHLDLEHPELAMLSRRCFTTQSLPRGSSIILRNGALVGDSGGDAKLVPMVYIFIFMTTRPDSDYNVVPSPEQSSDCRWLPVRLTLMPDLK